MALNVQQIGVGGLEISDYEKELVNEVLESNRLTYGPKSKAFEVQFANMHECSFGLFMNSGTSALQIALQSMKILYGWKDGDEVLVPATTFVATVNIVLHNNMKPVFVDVCPDSFNVDPSLIEEKITERTRCIIPVNLLGLPSDLQKITDIAKAYGLKVIEDSCETMFAKTSGKSVGAHGDIGCFSTYVAHFLVTGVGGLATTSDPELATTMRSLMNHGRDSIYISIDDDKLSGRALEEVVSKRFKFVHPGHSFRATELEAALGLGQLANKDEIISKRKNNADQYNRRIIAKSNGKLQSQSWAYDAENTYMLFGIKCADDFQKKPLINHLENNGVETRDLLPIVNQPIYQHLGLSPNRFPVSWMLTERAFYIGCHPFISESELNYLVNVFEEGLNA